MKRTLFDKLKTALHQFKSKITPETKKKPPFDPVDEASRESFPASDPPAYPSPRH